MDTGSFCSSINEGALKKIPGAIVYDTKVRAKGYTNDDVKFLGETVLKFKYKKHTVHHKFLVVPNNAVSLIGRDLCSKLNVKIEIPQQSNKMYSLHSDIAEKHKEYFSESFVSCVKHEVTLPMQEGATPVFCKARSIPMRYKDKLRSELDRLESLGIISPILSSSWASPICCVLKKDQTLRITGDYSKTINRFMTITRYPLPSHDEVVSKIGKSTIFSKIDMVSAFLQVGLVEASRKFTTINTPFGLYSYSKLPLGTSASPALFQKFLCEVLAGFDNILIYQDDILVFNESEQDHSCLLDKVLITLKNAGLKINFKKSKFFTNSIEYLGHIFENGQVLTNPEKVRAILEAPAPKDKVQAMSFIGLCNYYNRFIKNFSDVFAPLKSNKNALKLLKNFSKLI